jgi:DNA-binding transcriptional LysR family regulator
VSSSILSVLELTASGAGIGILPLFLASGHSDLMPLTEALEDAQTDVWLLAHPESRHLRRVSATYAHLAQAIRL